MVVDFAVVMFRDNGVTNGQHGKKLSDVRRRLMIVQVVVQKRVF